MFKYISVKFPETNLGITTLYSARLIQNRYEHEILVAEFKDWGLEYDVVTPGTAVSIKMMDGELTGNFFESRTMEYQKAKLNETITFTDDF